MHQYKVHLPTSRSYWENEDSDILESFFMSGINRDFHQPEEEESINLDNNLDLDKN
jgi:hypothetical protein